LSECFFYVLRGYFVDNRAREGAAALLYLQKEGIVHRDIAARNFLAHQAGRGGEYTIKLSDFGMSRNIIGNYYKKQDGIMPVRWYFPLFSVCFVSYNEQKVRS